MRPMDLHGVESGCFGPCRRFPESGHHLPDVIPGHLFRNVSADRAGDRRGRHELPTGGRFRSLPPAVEELHRNLPALFMHRVRKFFQSGSSSSLYIPRPLGNPLPLG